MVAKHVTRQLAAVVALEGPAEKSPATDVAPLIFQHPGQCRFCSRGVLENESSGEVIESGVDFAEGSLDRVGGYAEIRQKIGNSVVRTRDFRRAGIRAIVHRKLGVSSGIVQPSQTGQPESRA